MAKRDDGWRRAGRPERPLDPAEGPVPAFAYSLRQLRFKAGSPSYRELSRRAMFAPSVLSTAASGSAFPSLRVTLAYAGACGGDVGEWRSRWHATAAELAVQAARAGSRAPSEPAGSAGPAGSMGPEAAGMLDAAVVPRPFQLPDVPAHFTGRSDELRVLLALTDTHNGSRTPSVAITGPLGVGKTALALAFAHQAAPGYPDGQLHADLGRARAHGESAHTLTGRFLRALGLGGTQIPADQQQRLGLYRSVMATRRVLIALDNADSEAEIRPLLAAGPACLVVVTSRRRLAGLDSARRVTLDVLSPGDSRALASAVLGENRAAAAGRIAAVLGHLCGHLPLAVWIAATRLADRHIWTPGDVLEMTRDPGLLDWLQTGDVSLRHRLESAYRQLNPAARRAFRRLGHMASPDVERTGVPGLLRMPATTAERELETLIDAGLLQPSPVTAGYRIPALFALFARELLAKREPGVRSPTPA